jgi:hypothetical protein
METLGAQPLERHWKYGSENIQNCTMWVKSRGFFNVSPRWKCSESPFWDLRTIKKATGFKPSGVQVKLLPALCQWAWLEGTNHCWPVISFWPGYQPGSRFGYQITYLPGLRFRNTWVGTYLAQYENFQYPLIPCW